VRDNAKQHCPRLSTQKLSLGSVSCLICLLLLCGYGRTTCAASFDCVKAKSLVEKTICADPRLSALDDQVNAAYVVAKTTGDTSVIIKQQRAWLKERNICTTPACVEQMYTQRLKELEIQSKVSPFVRHIVHPQDIPALDKISSVTEILQSAPSITLPYPDIWGVELPVGANIFGVYPAATGDFIIGAYGKEKSTYAWLSKNKTNVMTGLFSGKQWRVPERDPGFNKLRRNGLLSFDDTKEIPCPVPIAKNDPDMRDTCYAEINYKFSNGNRLLYVHTDYELPYCYRERYFKYLALVAPDGRVLRQVTPIVVLRSTKNQEILGDDTACYGLPGGGKITYLNNWTKAPEITKFIPLADGTFLLAFNGFFEVNDHKGYLIRFDQNFTSKHPAFGKDVFMLDTKLLEKMGNIHSDPRRTIHENARKTDRRLYDYLTDTSNERR